MAFISYPFILIFLPATLAGYHLLLRRFGNQAAVAWLAAASLVFYGSLAPGHLPVLLGSVVFNFVGALLLERTRTRARWRHNALAGTLIGADLLLLGAIKYLGPMLDAVGHWSGYALAVPAIPLVLGVSFFTFQQIATLIRVHAGEPPERRFIHYVAYCTFFPQVLVGPLNRMSETIRQFDRPRRGVSSLDVAVGLTLFAIGLFKKTVLADMASWYLLPLDAGQAGAVSLFDAWSGSIAFAFHLYFDFSGYSDMAIGLARLFGIRLPANFASPFKAASLIGFWRRWHMTLTGFFTDHVYAPLALALTRKAVRGRWSRGRTFATATVLPTTVTLIAIGLWHGAGLQFIVFGALHAVGLSVNHGWRLARLPALPRPLAWMMTFGFVVATLALIRAPSLPAGLSLLQALAGMTFISLPPDWQPHLTEAAATLSQWEGHVVFQGFFMIPAGPPGRLALYLALLAICLIPPNSNEILRRYRPALRLPRGLPNKGLRRRIEWRPTLPWSITAATLLASSLLALNRTHFADFIYTRF